MKALASLTLLLALPLSASITYEVTTKTNMRRRTVEVAARVTADGEGRTRIEIVESDHEVFRTGMIVLANASDDFVTVIDPVAQTWFEFEPRGEAAELRTWRNPRIRVQPRIGIGRGMRGRGGVYGGFDDSGTPARRVYGEPEVTSEDRGNETLDGRIVRHHRVEIVRRTEDNVFVRRETIDVWSDEQLPAAARSWFHAGLLRDAGDIAGVPVRIRRKSEEMTQELSISAIAETAAEQTAFVVPDGYREISREPARRRDRR